MKQYITLALCLIILAASVTGLVVMYIETAAASTGALDERARLANATVRSAYLASATQFVSGTAADRAALGAFVAAPEDTLYALNYVEDAGSRARVTTSVQSVATAPLVAEFHESLMVSVVARGPFASVVRFGTLLESLPAGARVISGLVESAGNQWMGTYTVEFLKIKSI